MENKFDDVMKKKSDSELLEIITKLEDDYQPEAVEVARKEFEARGLTQEQLQDAKQEIIIKEEEITNKENEKLETLPRILFFIFFWGIIPWLLASTYKNKGFIRKYKDAWKSMKFGFLAYLVLIVIMLILVSV